VLETTNDDPRRRFTSDMKEISEMTFDHSKYKDDPLGAYL
jgi:hypothetical protein